MIDQSKIPKKVVVCPNHNCALEGITWDLKNGKANGRCPVSGCMFDIAVVPDQEETEYTRDINGNMKETKKYKVGILNPDADKS